MREACTRALQVARSVRERLRGNSSTNTAVAEEQRRNFAPYSSNSARKNKRSSSLLASIPKKCKTYTQWSAKFVCLANKDTHHIPSTVADKEVLVEAGLGEQKVCVPNVECTMKEFHEILVQRFPKLIDAGGFELLRCVANTRHLEPIRHLLPSHQSF